MRIENVEISNFRRLHSVRIDFSEETTLFVGANNSGKTSAMLALRRFLTNSGRGEFSLNDFTLALWEDINKLGEKWEAANSGSTDSILKSTPWDKIAPCLDLWLSVPDDELHYVSKLLPTLDWKGNLLGMRLRYEPKKPEEFFKAYRSARKSTEDTLATAEREGAEGLSKLRLWPENMVAFLEKHLRAQFSVQAYLLDPSRRAEPKDGVAQPQSLPIDAEPLDSDPLTGLIRVDEVSAQRGLGEQRGDAEERMRGDHRKLSAQLRTYYADHLDPFDNPTTADLQALGAITGAQSTFDERLKKSFESSLKEISSLGYPGVTDPKVTISTRLHPIEGLDHSSAVQYELNSNGNLKTPLRLPEGSNGLGYQNLISIVFRLMSYRDAWMRVGKAEKKLSTGAAIEPVHLVLVEEPEAHLHAQVQQVFIKQAYSVLRNHKDLRKDANSAERGKLTTQLIVSTHSSHVAHELDFEHLRYFRRFTAGKHVSVPSSTVVNLSTVFGDEDTTRKFVTRYLQIHHSDLFFADGVVLLEGAAERMFLPLFLRKDQFKELNQRYISLLEIGGSHAQTLQSLIEALGICTLIVTDIDALAKKEEGQTGPSKAELPAVDKGQTTSNSTLKKWLPRIDSIDDLLAANDDSKTISDSSYSIRVAYQESISVTLADEPGDAIPSTFEDALILSNIEFFRNLEGNGLTRKVRKAINEKTSVLGLSRELYESVRAAKKAEFALDIIYADDFDSLMVPKYIADGLKWLQEQLTPSSRDTDGNKSDGVRIR